MSPRTLSLAFLGLIAVPPVAQALWELSRGESIQVGEVVGPLEEDRLRAFEEDLRQASFVHRHAVPWYRWALLAALGRGNPSVTPGREGHLYFGEDLDQVTRPAFGAVGEAAVRATVLDLARQLDARDIALVLLPVPSKAAVQPEHLAARTSGLRSAEQGAVLRLLAELAEEPGLEVWDPGPRDGGRRLEYLPRDTHWTPATMEAVAAEVAELGRRALARRGRSLSAERTWRREPVEVECVGDLPGLLGLPPGREPWAPMPLTLRRVVDAATGEPFRPERGAEVLLLGDSFTLSFSDGRVGLGAEAAGLAEHLAAELGAGVDVIANAGGSARAVREALARRERGLEGKRLVVWQVSMRDLGRDPELWVPIALEPEGGVTTAPAEPAAPLDVRARLVEVTRAPAEFHYEFLLGVYEYQVLEVLEGQAEVGETLWVAQVLIQEGEAAPASTHQVGEEQRLRLEDVSRHHDLERTSWLDDTDSDPRSPIHFPVEPSSAGASEDR